MFVKTESQWSPSPRCGIVLAAGDGKRLKSFVRRLRGCSIPKQYVNVIGTRSMLEHTISRAERLIPQDRLFTVVSRAHLRYPTVRRQLSQWPRRNLVVQPLNKDTTAGLLLPLAHLVERYGESTVVVFPSDHFILEEELFIEQVEEACRVVERDCSRLIVLGIEPGEPESEYGYILPGEVVEKTGLTDIRSVSRFIEKPQLPLAERLVRQGGLWNTMVLVFRTNTLLSEVKKVASHLCAAFEIIGKAIGTMREINTVKEVYKTLEPLNFCQGVLEPLSHADPSHLFVLPVRHVHWSDWGSEHRILGMLERNNSLRSLNGTSDHGPSSYPRESSQQNSSTNTFAQIRARSFEDETLPYPFEPDILLPAQYFGTVCRKSFLEPEKRLMLAILSDAVACFQRHCFAASRKGKRLFNEASQWIFEENDDWLFSFERICEVLSLDPGYLRQGLLQWAAVSRKKQLLSRPIRWDIRLHSRPSTDNLGGKAAGMKRAS